MSRIGDLRRELQPATGGVYERRVARLFSIHLTVLFARLGVTPNAVSALGLACGAASAALVAIGHGWALGVGVALLHLYEILDCVDGELSRLTRRPSTRGLFLEDYSSYVMINGYYLAIGHRLFAQHGLAWALWAGVLVVAFGRNGAPVARRVILGILAKGRPTASPTPPVAVEPGSRSAGGRLARLRRLFEAVSPDYINVRMVLTTTLVVEVLAVPGRTVALPVVFAWYLGMQALREAGVVAIQVFTDAIDREVRTLRDVDR